MSSGDDWWTGWSSRQPLDGELPRDEPDDVDSMADAAAHMRDAADALRDAVTPAAPPKEKNWDFSYIWNWLRYTENGRAAKHASYSVAPLWTIVLTAQEFPLATAAGATLLGFVIVGGWHLRAERKATRLITWGLPLGLAYYAPVAIVFGLAGILVGG